MGAKSLNVYIESISLKAIRSVGEKNIQFTDSLCDVAKRREKTTTIAKTPTASALFSPQNFCK